MGKVGDGVGEFAVDLGGVQHGDTVFELGGAGVGAVAEYGEKRLVEAGVGVFAEAGQVDADAIAGGVGELFVKGAGERCGEGERSVAGDAVVDVMAEAEGQDEGGKRVVRIGELGDGFADFGDSGVFRVDVHVADDGAVAVKADGRVLDVEVDHGGAGNLLEELVVFAAAEGGHISETVVGVDGLGVGVGGVERAREDVEDGDAMADGEPMVNGKGKGESGVVAVRRKDEDVQEEGLQWARLVGAACMRGMYCGQQKTGARCGFCLFSSLNELTKSSRAVAARVDARHGPRGVGDFAAARFHDMQEGKPTFRQLRPSEDI